MVKKKIPLRKCTGCQQMKEKKELIRVVRVDENQYYIDLTGKMSGRGAYICKDAKCFEKAFKSKGLERSFKSAIPKDIYEKLRNELVLNE
ncbi:RNase P modulator RnpM [uncultured Tyzzerella sp.]|uniref:RNase P modulator RnpM n=1 Tax=uncultured Tyzzerella sp. TaxID=2321398 RepID=UPI002942D404|nr:YlxR family protein [uncultured Tyzzerella sp.]